MAVTLEQLLTHPRAFGLTTASPVQRACCRVVNGLPLGDLACDETVIRTFGGPEAIAALPGTKPTEFYLVGAIRSGKSLFTAAAAVWTALTIDAPSYLGPHEKMRISVISLDKDKAGIVMDHILDAMKRPGSALRRYLVDKRVLTKTSPPERIMLRRDDGRLVEIVIAAGKRAGASLVSRWTVAAIFDEAARMVGAADGVVNFDDSRKAVIARLRLIGGQLLAVTSPWIARGPIYNACEDNWGHPSDALVVVRATGPELNPVTWTPEACEKERLAPNSAYETDVLGLFANPESGWLSAVIVEKSKRKAPAPAELPWENHVAVSYTAAMDPGVTGNAWTLVILGRRLSPDGDETKTRYWVAAIRQWQGTPDQPLKARKVFGEMAPLLKEYKLSEVYTDRWSGTLITEIGDYSGVTVHVARDNPEQQAKNYTDFGTALVDGRVELSCDSEYCGDLLAVKRRKLPGGGVKYEAPVTRDGRHADYAPATVLAFARAKEGPSWVDAMNAARMRGGAFGVF